MDNTITLAIIGLVSSAILAFQRFQFGKLSARLEAVEAENSRLRGIINAVEKREREARKKVTELYERLTRSGQQL